MCITGNKYCHLFSTKFHVHIFHFREISAKSSSINNHSLSAFQVKKVLHGKTSSSVQCNHRVLFPEVTIRCMQSAPCILSISSHTMSKRCAMKGQQFMAFFCCFITGTSKFTCPSPHHSGQMMSSGTGYCLDPSKGTSSFTHHCFCTRHTSVSRAIPRIHREIPKSYPTC